MTVGGEKTVKAIPGRADIDEKYKWNLADLYKSENEWEGDFGKACELIEKAGSFMGRLGSSPALLYECLETRTNLSLTCSNLYQYAKLYQDLDNRVSKYQALSERAAMLGSRANAAYAFVEPELLTIDDSLLTDMAGRFPRSDVYDFYIKELIRSRKHVRSAEVEEILAQTQMIARGPDSIFTMLDDADIKYPSIKDEEGDDVALTKQRYAKFMESPHRHVRRDANDALNSVYRAHVNTLGATLASAINADVFYSRARRYESSLHMALDQHNIPVSVYHSLLDTTENSLSGLHRWIGLRKRILKLDDMYPYDVYCPLFPEQNYEISYHDAISEVLYAVAHLGDRYRSLMTNAFDNRWVDVYESEGKGSGAYSWGNYTAHPFILMNYNDTINNMFTLAHEMGHAMHSFLTNMSQPYPKAQYSIFVGEVASTLNEGLLLQYLLKKFTDKRMKLFLLNRHVDNTLGTFFHQVLYARFELMIHQIVEKGEALSPDNMGEIWEDLTRRYYGPGLTLDSYAKYKWARIPHFYRTYYVYQYATSYAASQALLDMFLSGEERIVEKYLELLSSGGSDHPIQQLKKCGIDMTTPDPVSATLRLFAEQVAEIDRLTAE
jgi:oligoendopeptidase F